MSIKWAPMFQGTVQERQDKALTLGTLFLSRGDDLGGHLALKQGRGWQGPQGGLGGRRVAGARVREEGQGEPRWKRGTRTVILSRNADTLIRECVLTMTPAQRILAGKGNSPRGAAGWSRGCHHPPAPRGTGTVLVPHKQKVSLRGLLHHGVCI